jgi:NADH-quinone oxidoreductase subunit N
VPAFDPNQLRLLSPEILLSVCACLLLLLSLMRDEARRWGAGLAALACAVTLAALAVYPMRFGLEAMRIPDQFIGFGGAFVLDSCAVFFKGLFLMSALLTLLFSARYLQEGGRKAGTEGGEYYALVLFAIVGMMLVASAGDFLTLFVALETTALALYPLVGYARGEARSIEGALKYFLIGSFATALFLFGTSLVYGLTGTVSFGLIGMSRSIGALEPAQAPYFLLGMILVIAGLGFKVAAVPFHMWAPDAYQGAPTPITGLLSTASKAAGFVAMLRLFPMAFGRLGDRWSLLLVILSVASMTIGTFAALTQDNVKRMLAYSSIAHAGYALLGLIAAGRGPDLGTREWGIQSVLLYLLVYTFVNLGAFGMVAILRRRGVAGDRVADFAGLGRKSPLAAFAMLVFLLSLAGIPATAGFVGKWYLFAATVHANLAWLAVVAVVNSAVSLYFYARIVVMMYMREPADDIPFRPSLAEGMAIAICLVFTLVFGLYPRPIVELTRHSIIAFAPWAL